MGLDELALDDLRWADQSLRSRSRIPAASGGEWTLHAPVDPGVTLLELFDWLLEQRSYWADHPPDSVVRLAGRLLGEAPRAARAAGVVVAFEPETSLETLAAATQIARGHGADRITFETTSSLTVLDVDRVELEIAGQRAPLAGNGPVSVFGAEAPDAFALVLWLRKELTPASEPLSVLIELAPPVPPPDWDPDAVPDVPPPGPLRFAHDAEGGWRAPFAPEAVTDGTAGLRRSGLLQVEIPRSGGGRTTWIPAESRDGLRAYRLWVETDPEIFPIPPRLQRAVPNAALARHRYPAAPVSAEADWLALPGNVFELPEDTEPPFSESVEAEILEADQVWRGWLPVSDRVDRGRADRVFVVDRTRRTLHFGDGVTGRVPVVRRGDGDNVVVRYEVGGGERGNVSRDLEWEATVGDTKLVASNPVPGLGGREPEDLDGFRMRVADDMRSCSRTVTADDFRECVLGLSGVVFARAHVALGVHPAQACPVPGAVTLFVVPAAYRGIAPIAVDLAAPALDAGALAYLRTELDRRRLLTSEVFVQSPVYRPVALRVEVRGVPAEPDAVRSVLQQRLQRHLDPLVGGADEAGWPFGEPLRPSDLMRVVQGELAAAGSVRSVAIRLLDAEDEDEECRDVEIREHELPVLQRCDVTFFDEVSTGGVLR